jgi:ABC-type lipoprotein export system ATPase subunit
MVTHDLRMVDYTDRTLEIVDGRLLHSEDTAE